MQLREKEEARKKVRLDITSRGNGQKMFDA
jgi:hypothetical protein